MKFDLVVFDIDGTVTRHVSSWQFLHERLGQWDEQAVRYQDLFRAGRISYRKFCRLDAAHWKGLEAEKVARIIRDIPYARNVEAAVGTLKRAGFSLAAVSTGIQFIVDRVREELGLDYAVGNRLNVRAGKLTGKVTINVPHLGKGKVLKDISRRFRIPPRRMIVVGDSDGDIPMMRMAGYSIAVNASSPALRRAADYCCRTDDFLEVCNRISEVSSA